MNPSGSHAAQLTDEHCCARPTLNYLPGGLSNGSSQPAILPRTHLIVFLTILVICFSHLQQGSLSIDGIRYAAIADRINTGGSPFALYDAYTNSVYLNKPPPLFWLTAASFKIFGFSTFSARLPGAVFAALALWTFWRIVSSSFGLLTGFLSLVLFVSTRSFFRTVPELNFEGMLLLSALCFFDVALRTVRGRPFTWRQWTSIGIGLILAMISKPPYVVVFAPATIFAFAVTKSESVRVHKILFAALTPVAMLAIGLSLLRMMPEAVSLKRALDNQVIEPLTLTQSFGRNLFDWFAALFVSYAPLSWCGLAAIGACFRQQRRLTRETWFLLIWSAPTLAIMLFAECRARYLLVPLIAVAVLGGRYLQELLLRRFQSPKTQRHIVELIAFSFVAVTLLLINGFRLQFHVTNPYVLALRSSPALLADQSLIVCTGEGVSGDVAHPAETRTAMLLRLEFKRDFTVYDSMDLPQSLNGSSILADEGCIATIEQRGHEYQTTKRYPRTQLISIPD